MFILTLFGAMLSQTPPASDSTIGFKDGVFVVTTAGKATKVPLTETYRKPPTTLLIREGESIIAYDQRGITIQRGKRARSTRLADFITSPRYFSKEQIVDHVERIKSRDIARDFSTVSGYERVGDNYYFLIRWNDKKNTPWLEALIKVNLDADTLLPEPLQVMQGISQAKVDLDDQLLSAPDGLAAVTQVGDKWGVEYYSEGLVATVFTPVGLGSAKYRMMDDGKSLAFVEQTDYGMNQAGKFVLPSGPITRFTESRDPVKFTGDEWTVVQIDSPSKVTLRSLESGLELNLPKDVGVRSIKSGVLVWTPAKAPRAAFLYSNDSLRAIAKWSSTAPSSATPARRKSN